MTEPGGAPERCLLCTAASPRRLFFRSGKWFWICDECDLVFVHDIYPEYLENLDYLDDAGRFSGCTGPKPRQQREHARLLAEFNSYRRHNRLLEVGCSAGLFLAEAKAAGWQCSGVEILPAIARLAGDSGLDVRTGDLFRAGFADNEFDVVYMNEVIEHVVDPIALMTEVRRVVRPGGLALVRTGNARSWSARWRGAKWHYYRFGGHAHIRFYSPRAAQSLGKAAGFVSVASRTRGFAFLESGEMRGRWFKPAAKLGQALISPLAGCFDAGHRLTMRFFCAPAASGSSSRQTDP